MNTLLGTKDTNKNKNNGIGNGKKNALDRHKSVDIRAHLLSSKSKVRNVKDNFTKDENNYVNKRFQLMNITNYKKPEKKN